MQKMISIVFCSFIMYACSSNDEKDTINIIGTWHWVSSCGGFTGGCWYPDVDNYESIEFNSDLVYIQKVNDLIVLQTRYLISDTIINGLDVVYTIEFDNGRNKRFRIINDTLSFEGGDFWKDYKKVE